MVAEFSQDSAYFLCCCNVALVGKRLMQILECIQLASHTAKQMSVSQLLRWNWYVGCSWRGACWADAEEDIMALAFEARPAVETVVVGKHGVGVLPRVHFSGASSSSSVLAWGGAAAVVECGGGGGGCSRRTCRHPCQQTRHCRWL